MPGFFINAIRPDDAEIRVALLLTAAARDETYHA